jgi:shikimate kinase
MTAPITQILDIGLKSVNVYLIGLMGAGKTTTGKLLAQQLGYQFFDTDALVEQVAGRCISEIFAESGEAHFRDLETQVLAEISAYPRLVVATGGGMVLKPMNWSYLHHGIVVWLNVDPAHLAERLAADQSRPLLATTPQTTPQPTDRLSVLEPDSFAQAPPQKEPQIESQSQSQKLQKLQTLWAERQHLYRQADLEVAITATQSADQVVNDILVGIPKILKQ